MTPAPPGRPVPAVAATVADLTPEWCTAALGRPVTAVTATRVGTGQIGLCFRLDLTYADDGAGTPGPASLVAKLAAPDVTAGAQVSEGYVKEVAFYTSIVGSLAVTVPHCWYGAVADDGATFTLLLDDLAPARPGVQADGCTIAEAEAAVANLVGLHAPRWNDPDLLALGVLDRFGADGAEFLGAIHEQMTEQFVARYADVLDAADVATLRAAAAATARWIVARPEPFAVVHGDYRLDNQMFGADGSVHALDWQTVSIGPPARDLAYFLGTCLHTDDRRRHEAALVERYASALVGVGVPAADVAGIFDDYRLGQFQGPLITVLGSEFATVERTPAADGMFLAMARRSCAAIRDLDALALVG